MSPSFHAAALAAAVAAAPDAEVVVQPKITVTASRVEQTLDQSLASVTVISREDIESSQAADLFELLRSQVGVDLARAGGPGSQTSLFLRGSNSNHTLVLVDGVRVASVHTGAFAWENLPVAHIDHIEIVRGPRAGYYGSDAMGGVIHVHTRRPAARELSLTAGSFGTQRLEAGGALDVGGTRAAIQLNYHQSDGFSAQNPGGFSFDPDDDGLRERGAVLALGRDLGAQRADARVRVHRAEVEFDQGESETEADSVALRLSGPLGQRWRHALNLGWVDEDRSTPAFFTRFDSERADLDWQFNHTAGSGRILTLGLAYVEERGASLDTFAGGAIYAGSRRNAALFGAWQVGLARQDLEFALRYDDNSEFGAEWTGHVAWARQLGQRAGIFFSYGHAFRAPTLSEQLSPGIGGLFAGNPALAPERSRAGEFGLRLNWPRQRLAASLYSSRIDDLISFTGEDFQARNVARARIDGFEVEYQWRSPDWRFDGNLTLQQAEDRMTGETLLRRPERKLAVAMDRLFTGGARLGLDALYSGARADFGGRLDDYVLLGLRATHPLSRHWRAEVRLSNLLDQNYELAQGFNTAGRAVSLSLRFRGD